GGGSPKPEFLPEVECRHLSHLGERPADQELGRFVVEDQRPGCVDEEHRRREIRSKLPSEDQRKALRLPGRGRHIVTLLNMRRVRCWRGRSTRGTVSYDEDAFQLYLGQVPMFQACSEEELSAIAYLATPKAVGRGTAIVREG